ncbi:MAG TPA: molybdopterin cofactor-binding domain-containing protein [Vicinamibacterales bacterium]|jgi:isoquinoline 1-oxidoreductase beta subunit|nr:molybdopterin cofactor-binding domain-containing protein [Vicinamibacterales bacterium]
MVIENVSLNRRQFLGGIFSTGAFVVASRLIPAELFAQGPAGAAILNTKADTAALHPSVYLGIEPDGTVFIVTHRSEMGTGIRTSLPLVAADELDADWSRCRIEQGVGDTRYGDQNTDGSRSIRDFYDAFRVAGASARSMLIAAAAAQWNVPASELTTANHEVVHARSNRKVGYGALVPAAAKMPVPAKESLTFKPKTAWKFVGKDTNIYDLTPIVTGTAQFGLDVYREGMVYASIEHPPVVGGTVKSLDNKAALAVKGVTQTETLAAPKPPLLFQTLGGVAVIGNSTWAVLQGRKQLKIEWNDGPHAGYTTAPFKAALLEKVKRPAKVARNLGNVDAEFAKGGTVMEAAYYTPMAAHASMEPPAAVAEFRNGKAEIWCPTQNPQAAQETVAAALGIDKNNVICHVTLLGGGFGRKSKPDYAAEAAILAKQLGKPVKVVWTREDDIHHDFYHTTAAVYHKATVDAKGRPTAWLQRSVFPPIASTFGAPEPMGFELDMGLDDTLYDVPNIRAENAGADAHVRIGWFRAVTNNFHAFAAHSFADEMAHAAKRDPLEFLLDLLGPGKIVDLKAQGVDYSNYGAPIDKYPLDSRRLRRVLEVAGERSGWAKRKSGNGRGMGIAAHRSFNSYVASVVEVEVDQQGRVKIPRIHQVADPGVVINPDRVRAQFEGAAVMGVGLAMFGEITATNGRIDQKNFDGFRVARMNDAPVQVDVHFVESGNLPTGVGEPGVPPVIAALANAIYAATGKRLREMPFSKQKLV